MALQNPAEIDSRAATGAYLVDQFGVPLAGGQGVQAAASDARANSQLGQLVDSRGMGWNGTTWDRLKTKANGWQGVTLVRSTDGAEVTIDTNSNVDGAGATGPVLNSRGNNYRYNGATWDRQRGNTEGTLLASAARTATTVSPIQTNHNARGVIVWLNVTLASGTGGLQVRVQGQCPVSAAVAGMNAAPTAIIATGLVGYAFYPGSVATGAGIVQVSSVPLPRTWQVSVTHADGSSYTYSLGYSLIV